MRNPKVTKSCKDELLSRITEFSIAIHNYGVERLYNDLKSNEKITDTYPLETFRTDFKRMKKDANGFLNEPALIGAMCEILQFPVSTLFGGPLSTQEKNIGVIKNAVNNVLHEYENERKQPKKRIYITRIINNGYMIHNIIAGITSGYLTYEPFMHLFVWYSANNKSWDIPNEPRIKTLLEKILNRGKGQQYYYNYHFMVFPTNFTFPPDIKLMDDFLNHCLMIAYQLSCIEKLYKIHQKSNNIRPKKLKGIPPIIHSSKVQQDIAFGNNDSDLFAKELRVFSDCFDKLVNMLSQDMQSMKDIEPLFPDIINNFQKIIEFLLRPELKDRKVIDKLGDSSPIIFFLSPEYIIRENYVLKVTDKEIGILRDNTSIITGKDIIGIYDLAEIEDFEENDFMDSSENRNIGHDVDYVSSETNEEQPKKLRDRDEQDDLIDANL